MSYVNPSHARTSLFDKYGGFRVLRGVIMDFYDRVLDNDELYHFFVDVDMARLIDHQTKFFTMVLGGPASFSDERIARAHAHMTVNHTQFDEVVVVLRESLVDAGLTAEDIETTLAAIEARRGLIVR